MTVDTKLIYFTCERLNLTLSTKSCTTARKNANVANTCFKCTKYRAFQKNKIDAGALHETARNSLHVGQKVLLPAIRPREAPRRSKLSRIGNAINTVNSDEK